MYKGTRFTRGDFIQATLPNGSVVRGTALDTRNVTGYAFFQMAVPIDQHGGEEVLSLNLNHVEVELLFDAQLAREMEWDA